MKKTIQILLVLFAVATSPALASGPEYMTMQNYDNCGNTSVAPDVQIADCNKALTFESTVNGKVPNWIYINRGTAFAAKGRHDLAIQDYTKSLSMTPSYEAYFDRGLSYLADLKPDLAIKDFESALSLSPSENAELYALLGNAYNENSQPDRAIEYYDKSIAIAPSYAAYVDRGGARYHAGKFDDAMDDFNKALALNAQDGLVFRMRGKVFAARKQYDLAMQDFDKSLQLAPEMGDTYAARGSIFYIRGDYVAALADFDNAVKFNPTITLFLIQRAGVHLKLKQYPDAIADYSAALSIAPDAYFALNGRCWARAVRNIDIDKAVVDCNDAIKLDPKSAAEYDSRGFVYFRMNDYAHALTDYNAALAIDAKLAGSLYMRGITKLRMGDGPGGNIDVAAAKAIDPKIGERYAGYGVMP